MSRAGAKRMAIGRYWIELTGSAKFIPHQEHHVHLDLSQCGCGWLFDLSLTVSTPCLFPRIKRIQYEIHNFKIAMERSGKEAQAAAKTEDGLLQSRNEADPCRPFAKFNSIGQPKCHSRESSHADLSAHTHTNDIGCIGKIDTKCCRHSLVEQRLIGARVDSRINRSAIGRADHGC
jgi:hypothetical protein